MPAVRQTFRGLIFRYRAVIVVESAENDSPALFPFVEAVGAAADDVVVASKAAAPAEAMRKFLLLVVMALSPLKRCRQCENIV